MLLRRLGLESLSGVLNPRRNPRPHRGFEGRVELGLERDTSFLGAPRLDPRHESPEHLGRLTLGEAGNKVL